MAGIPGVIRGLADSFLHNQNGMTERDMLACGSVATALNEVIIFRSTGPWAKRWIEKGYPTKNFHVKGKSSDWGPHAGLVPYDGTYSKVGYDSVKAAKGTKANDDGLHSGFAGRAPLVLSLEQIREHETRPEGRPARTALFAVAPVPGGKDLTLTARRSGDDKPFIFLARHRQEDGQYDILVYPSAAPRGVTAKSPYAGRVTNNAFVTRDRDPTGATAMALEVMTSEEVGANHLPMTGDYDLLAVCPTWADYGGRAARDIEKDGISLHNGTQNAGLSFSAGRGMDNVMDGRLATGGTRGMDFTHSRKARIEALFNAKLDKGILDGNLARLFTTPFNEHPDMGNLTPRILRCIVMLNAAMGATGAAAALRRVHHNAESHRYHLFGALTEQDMVTRKDGELYGDGFPFTVFQPLHVANLMRNNETTQAFADTVCTLESLPAFQAYAVALAATGYYVPRNWVWNMHTPPRASPELLRFLKDRPRFAPA